MSNGSLPGAVIATPSIIAVSLVTFNWVNHISTGITKASDKAFIVVYCAKPKAEYIVLEMPYAVNLRVVLLPNYLKEIIYTCIVFVTAYNKHAAPSFCTGIVSIPI